MHSVLFVADIDFERKLKWQEFTHEITKEPGKIDGVERLSINVWLLDLTKPLEGLGKFSHLATVHNIYYSVLVLEGPPKWLPSDRKPNPIPDRIDQEVWSIRN